MEKYAKVLILILLAAVLVSPVSALITNDTGNANYFTSNTELISGSYFHDANYIPIEYEYLLIALGLLCLAISRIFKSAEDIFSIGAAIPIGLSAWYANYMTAETMDVIAWIDNSTLVVTPHIIYNQVITPFPALSVVMVVFFLISILNIIWIFFMQDADAGLEKGGEKV